MSFVSSPGAVKVTVDRLIPLLANIPQRNSAMVWGGPGIGKTSAARVAAKILLDRWLRENPERASEVDSRFGSRHNPQPNCFEEYLASKPPEDLEGVPFPAEVNGMKFTVFAPPFRLAPLFDADGPPIVLLLDEITSANETTQAVGMSIVLERRIGSHFFGDNVYVFAAGNRAEDRAVFTEMSKPLENRLEHYEAVVDEAVWARWALNKGIDPSIVGYIHYQPTKLNEFDPDNPSPAFATPRSWEYVDRRIRSMGWHDPELPTAISACIGEGSASPFLAFRSLRGDLPDPREIIADPSRHKVPAQVDRRYFVLSSLASVLFKEASLEGVTNALLYVTQFEPEQGAKFLRDLILTPNAAQAYVVPAFETNKTLEKRYESSWAEVLELIGQAA
jgi:hypothetical protein